MMQMQSLTGAWQFRQAEPPAGAEEWLPATVPGGVHTDLLALGRIPDPFVGDNEKRVQWVAEAIGNTAISLPSRPSFCASRTSGWSATGWTPWRPSPSTATCWASTDNMFRQYRWDVKPLLKADENELRIDFASPVHLCGAAAGDPHLPGVSQAIPGGPHCARRPASSAGIGARSCRRSASGRTSAWRAYQRGSPGGRPPAPAPRRRTRSPSRRG